VVVDGLVVPAWVAQEQHQQQLQQHWWQEKNQTEAQAQRLAKENKMLVAL